MQVHALQTGIIRTKRSYRAARGSNRLMRLTSVLLDKTFTDLPIYVWAIEHPEGVIVIDAGETAQVNQPDFFPAVQRPYWRSQYRFLIRPEDESGNQLRALGIPPESVRWVVMTHAHFDHSDALYHFPNAEVIFSEKEYRDTMLYRSARFAFPSKWPKWLRPRVFPYVPEPVGPFSHSFPLTKAGDVRLVHTPGHTMGHLSVILQEGERSIFFGGDTAFDQTSLLDGTIDAPAFNADAVRDTRRKILELAQDRPLVYLATHDPDTARRLDAREPVRQMGAQTDQQNGMLRDIPTRVP